MSPPTTPSLQPTPAVRRRDVVLRRVLVYVLILVIAVADAATPAGVVVGILLAIPILLASLDDDPRQVLLATATALVAFVAGAIFGEGPISPRAVWLPNRVFVVITLVACGPLALRLQRQRLVAEAARRAAEASRDLTRLLHSLMAHDLRAPLAVATQALELARGPAGAADPALLADAEEGLRRSLASIDRVVVAARAALADPAARATASGDDARPAAAVIENVVRGLEDVTHARGQVLRLEIQDSVRESTSVDSVVLEHALSILLDNVVRHGSPGPVYVGGNVAGGELLVVVADSGPGVSVTRARPQPSRGAGLGLELARLLVANAGGALTLERDEPSGSEFLIRLPTGRTSARATGGDSAQRPHSRPD